MRKVLILGSTGLLGQAMVDEFVGDFEVVAPKRSELDLLDFEVLSEFIKSNQPDFILNCAGYNFVDKAELNETERSLCFRLNSELPTLLADLQESLNYVLVQFSSDYVFDGKNSIGYKENASPSPLSTYGQSKLDGEIGVSGCSKLFLVRLAWLFGPGKESNFVDVMRKLAKTHDEISVVDDQKGNPTYTKDVAAEIRQLIETDEFGVYHLVNEDPVTWYDLAMQVFTKIGYDGKVKKVSSKEFKREAVRPQYSILLNTKWKKLRSHKDALKDYLDKY
jgi:dTDP-4-dehydrorhamnose reductase